MGCCCPSQLVGQEYEDRPDVELSCIEKFEHKLLRTDESTIVLAKEGIAAREPTTLIELWKKTLQLRANEPALAYEPDHAETMFTGKKEECPPSKPIEQWKTWTYQEYHDDANALARAHYARGFEWCDGVAIWGFNSPHWLLASASSVFAGGISMGIYPTDTREQVAYKIRHCACPVVFVQDAKKQAMIEDLYKNGELMVGVKEQYCRLKSIVVWGAVGEKTSDLDVYSYEDYLAMGRDAKPLPAQCLEQSPSKVIYYVYTSGTTGTPKACMLTHDNLIQICLGVTETVFKEEIRKGGNLPHVRCVSYLPLSHVAATLMDIVSPQLVASGISEAVGKETNWTVYFARQYDLKKSTLPQRWKAVKPTAVLAVPRVFEKLELVLKGLAKKGCIGAIMAALKNKNLRNAENAQLGGSGSTECCTCCSRGYTNLVKGLLGWSEARVFLTGAAPIRIDTLRYFASLDVNILEVYGMSESTGVSNTNKIGFSKWGTVGGALPGVEVGIFDFDHNECKRNESTDIQNISEDAQGEIRIRGRGVMLGYMGNPELGQEHMDTLLKKNQAAILPNGWLRTGDKGTKMADGAFKITGRYKELIITAGGENVAPIPIEDGFKNRYAGISNVMLVGDEKPYNVALITVQNVGYTGFETGTNVLDNAMFRTVKNDEGLKTMDDLFAKNDSKVIEEIRRVMQEVNKDGNCCPSRASTVKKFMILPEDFSVENGFLTPTLKLKRSVVVKHYQRYIDAIYASEFGVDYVNYSQC